MAQYGPVSTGKYGGEPSAARVERMHSDRINAPMDRVEPTAVDPQRDPAAFEAELGELPTGDDPVLASRQGRQSTLARPGPTTLVPPWAIFVITVMFDVAHGGRVDGGGAQVCVEENVCVATASLNGAPRR
jgi:hypothetical protein